MSTPSSSSPSASGPSLSFFCPARLAAGQLNLPSSRALSRHPQAGPVEVEQLDARAAAVGEHEQRIALQPPAEVHERELAEPLEALAHVLGFERDVDLEGSRAEADHLRPPLRRALMSCAASSTAESSATSRRSPPSSSIIIRVPTGAANSTSMKRTSLTRPACPRDRGFGFLVIRRRYRAARRDD